MTEEVTLSTSTGRDVLGKIEVGDSTIVGSLTHERSVSIPGWIMSHPDLSDRAVRLWGYLKGSLNGSFAIPGTSHRSLAVLLDVSERTAREAIYELRDAGAVTIVPTFVEGRQQHNTYYLWPAKPVGAGVETSDQGGSQLPAVYKNISNIKDIKDTTQKRSNADGVAKKTRNEYDEEFDALWQIYPRRINKVNAYKAFRASVKRGASMEELTLAVRNYASERVGQDEQYTMHGATFFGKSERWRDYLPRVEVPFVMGAEVERIARIWDLYDAGISWSEENGLDNPAKHGYSRVRNAKGQLVDASGIPYELDAQGARRQVGYWN